MAKIMRPAVRYAAVPVFVLLLASHGLAVTGFYLGFLGGWAQEKAKFENIQFNTDTSFIYGVRAGVRISTVAVEIAYAQVAHNLNPSNPVQTWPGRDVDYNYVGVNLRWIIPVFFLNPYLTGGLGYYTADLESLERKRDAGFNIGAGIEIMLGRTFALVAEGKFHTVHFDLTGGEIGTLKLDHVTITGGLNIYF